MSSGYYHNNSTTGMVKLPDIIILLAVCLGYHNLQQSTTTENGTNEDAEEDTEDKKEDDEAPESDANDDKRHKTLHPTLNCPEQAFLMNNDRTHHYELQNGQEAHDMKCICPPVQLGVMGLQPLRE